MRLSVFGHFFLVEMCYCEGIVYTGASRTKTSLLVFVQFHFLLQLMILGLYLQSTKGVGSVLIHRYFGQSSLVPFFIHRRCSVYPSCLIKISIRVLSIFM